MTPEKVYQRAMAVIQSLAEPGQKEMVRRYVERSIAYIEKCPGPPDLNLLCDELRQELDKKTAEMAPVTMTCTSASMEMGYDPIGYRLTLDEFHRQVSQRIGWPCYGRAIRGI